MKRRKRILLLLGMLLLFCSCKQKQASPGVTFVDELITVEYGTTDFDPMTLIIWGNWDSLRVEETVFDTLGLVDVKFIVTKDGIDHEYIKVVEVVDTTFPIFEKSVKEIKTKLNQEITVSEYFSAVDPIDGEVEVFLSSEINLKQAGTHYLDVIARDSNGNETRIAVTIIVGSGDSGNGGIGGNNGGNGNNNNQNNSQGNNNGNNNNNSNNDNQTNDNQTTTPSFVGVKDIYVQVNSSMDDLFVKLEAVYLNVSGSYTYDYSQVNLSVPGTYTVYYTSSTGASASCRVIVSN